ncbi:MAG: glycyl-radical enzyme activating protein [Victivallaceae bacterium]|nr:glycyl-radical enzyme activating protein [Victivallaceae bacterium]
MNGVITQIQHGSVHDGPGLRSVVFLKGCQLGCFWCHNPETLSAKAQLSFDASKCLDCGRCFALCCAHRKSDAGHWIAREECNACFRCVEACFAGALSICGRDISLEEAIEELESDRLFYLESGGGVTLSGGEPGMQLEFSAALLAHCRKEKIHTAVETNLAYSRDVLEKLTENCDLVMADLKHLDCGKHREGTGRGNEEILANLCALRTPLILRTPIVPGFNDDAETIGRIASFASELKNLQTYELLTYHPLGCGKAARLGMAGRTSPLPLLRTETINQLTQAATSSGVPLLLNGKRVKK